MTEQLLIRVDQSQQKPIHWLVWSKSQEQIIASGEIEQVTELSSLQEKSLTRETIVLMPASAVQLKTLDLPSKWNRKLEQALPFMLEEQVACDIEELFIATGESRVEEGQHQIRLALCNKAWLTTWVEAFKDAGIQVKQILPDALLLDDDEEIVTGIQLGEQWLFRHKEWQIGAAEPTWLNSYLQISGVTELAHLSPAPMAAPNNIQLTAREGEYDLPLAVFARGLKQTTFNLLQGEFQQTRQQPQWWRDWQSGIIAASVALVGFVAVKGAQIYMLNEQAEAFQKQAVAVYKDAFPNKRIRPHLMKSQIQNELNALSGEAQGGFLELTEHFVSIYSQVPEFTPETLRFDQRRNEIRIRARAKEFQVFGQVKAILEQRGITVTQGALSNDGDFVVGEIRLRGDA